MRPLSGFTKRVSLVTAAAGMLSLLQPNAAHAVGTVSGTVIESTATMTYKDANDNSYNATSNTVTATVTEVYSVSLTCAGDQSTNSSTTTYYACTVTNTGNAPNTFTLAATSSPVWTTLIYRDDGAGVGGTANDGIHTPGETTETASTGAIGPDATYKFFVATTVPASKENGATAVTTLTVTGINDPAAVDDASDTMTTTALAPAISVFKELRNVTQSGAYDDEGITAKPLEILEYRVKVTNNGTVEATEVVLQETLNTNLEYVAGSMRYSAAAVYEGASVLTDAGSGDAGCGALVHECGTATFSGGVLTFRLGASATESTGGALGTTKTVYVFFHAKVK